MSTRTWNVVGSGETVRRLLVISCAIAVVAFADVCPARADGDTSAEVQRLRKELEAEKNAREADRAAFERRLEALEHGGGAGAAAAPTGGASPGPAPSGDTEPGPAPEGPEGGAPPEGTPSSGGAAAPEHGLTREEVTGVVEDYLTERDLFQGVPENAVIPSAGTLLDLSVVLDATVGTSTATDDALSGAIALGDHDPHVRGFNARNEEVVASADVDPYFYGFFDVVYKLSEEGESEFELEEAYALTTSLPCSLQLKIGQFFTEFGRLNPSHPHTWQFVNFPVILGRAFGADGLRGQGARLSWIVPHTCFPVTLLAGVQNARGETQVPFFGADGEEIGLHEYQHHDVKALDDLAYHFRAEASKDFRGVHCGTLSVLGGASFAIGPNGTGEGGRTRVYGGDLFLKWRADKSDAGWPWAQWQTEFLLRDFRAADQDRLVDDGLGGTMPVHVDAFDYIDKGFYSELVYGFHRPWSVGLRVDQAWSNGAYAGDHTRVSGALTYYPSEFSRIRLQVSYDDVTGLSSAFPRNVDGNWSVWLNFDFSLGKHGAHKF